MSKQGKTKMLPTWSKRTTSENISPIGRSCLTTSVLMLKGMLETTCKEKRYKLTMDEIDIGI